MSAIAGSAAPLDRTGLRVRLISDLEALDALRQDWCALEAVASDHGATFFQSHAWCRHVVRIRQASPRGRFQPAIVTVYQGDELVALWPLSLQRRAGIWMFCNLDDPFGQFAGMLCRRSDWIEPCVTAALGHLRGSGMAEALCIASVLDGTPLLSALQSAGAREGSTNEAVQVDMRSAATFVDYSRTLNAKTRKNLRNAMNRLERHGDVAHVVVEKREDLAALIRATFKGRLAWMRERGKSTDAFRDADFRPLVEEICKADGITPIGFELRSRGEVIASQWGFVHGQRYYAYISAREHGHDQFSPGRLHLGSVIESCKGRGLDVLELMAPASRYKRMWANRVTGIRDMWLPLSWRGRVAIGAVRFGLPAANGLVRLLPQGLKSRLAGKVNAQ